MKPAPILDSARFKWIAADRHMTIDGVLEFRSRQEARRVAAQGAPANVKQLRKGKQ